MTPIMLFASSEPSSGGIFGALGINFQVLVIQIIAFIILLLILKKFVYPWLIKSVDDYRDNLEAASKAATEARFAADDTKDKVAKILKEAQVSASDIILTAKLEAATLLGDSEEKAKKRSEQIVASAQEDIKKEVIAAKKALHDETLELVALATEKVLGKVITDKTDSKLIDEALREIKQ